MEAELQQLQAACADVEAQLAAAQDHSRALRASFAAAAQQHEVEAAAARARFSEVTAELGQQRQELSRAKQDLCRACEDTDHAVQTSKYELWGRLKPRLIEAMDSSLAIDDLPPEQAVPLRRLRGIYQDLVDLGVVPPGEKTDAGTP